MLIRLGELRRLILWESILIEADISRLMPRASRGRGLVVIPVFMGERLVALDDSRTETVNINGTDIELPSIVGTVTGSHSGDAWIIDSLYADDPATAVYLLGAALAMWERVKPDKSVSPAARAVIRRYWEDNKDDPSLVQSGEDDPNAALVRAFGGRSTRQAPEDFMSSVFLDPGGVPLNHMLSSGEKIVDRYEDENDLLALIANRAAQGFIQTYGDKSRTGFRDES